MVEMCLIYSWMNMTIMTIIWMIKHCEGNREEKVIQWLFVGIIHISKYSAQHVCPYIVFGKFFTQKWPDIACIDEVVKM